MSLPITFSYSPHFFLPLSTYLSLYLPYSFPLFLSTSISPVLPGCRSPSVFFPFHLSPSGPVSLFPCLLLTTSLSLFFCIPLCFTTSHSLFHLFAPRPPRLSNSFHQCTSASFTHQNNVSRGRQTNVSDSLPSYLTISNRVIYRWKKKVFPCLEHYAEIELTQAVCLFLDERGSFFGDERDDRQPRDQPTPSHRLMLTHQSSLSEFLKMLTPLLHQMESSCCPLSRPWRLRRLKKWRQCQRQKKRRH